MVQNAELEIPILEKQHSEESKYGVGITLVFLCFQLSISIAQVGTKLLSRFYLMQVMFIRALVGLFLGTYYCRKNQIQWMPLEKSFNRNAYIYLFIRSLVGFSAMFVTLYAVRNLNLTEAEGLLQSAPMFATFLARIFLNEEIFVLDFVLAFVCFFGVMIIATQNNCPNCQPKANQNRFLGIICGILSSLGRGVVKCLIRFSKSMNLRDEVVVQYYQFFFVIFGFFGSLFYEIPSDIRFHEILWFLVIGALGQVGQMCMTYCYQRKPVIEWMCFEYVKIIYSIFFDFVVFGFSVPFYQILGCSLIAASGIIKYFSAKNKKECN